MTVYELQAKIGLDTKGFDEGLKKSKKSMSEYKSDVMKLAQTYREQGMSMSDAMKRAYSEIDKSQYETAETAQETAKEFSANWKDASDTITSVSEKIGSGLKTIAKAGAAAISAGTAALVALGTASIKSYAEYEQLVGGVETLFEDSAGAVMSYAENAYKAAGLSANEYMNTVTSFSASLISSLGGNTVAAAEVANRAITDMSDNANKMGTDIGMLQNAYQGFAKQNYTIDFLSAA